MQVAFRISMGTFERHYTVKELAEMWNFSEETIRRLFRDEAGVVKLGRLEYSRKKRSYVALRIPESVAIRVHERLRNGTARLRR